MEQNYFLPKLYWQLKWFWTKPLISLAVVGLFLISHYRNRDSSAEQLETRVSKIPWFFHWWILGFVIYYLIAAQGLVNNPTNLNIINPAAAALAGNTVIAITSRTKQIMGKPGVIALITAILLLIGGVGAKHLKPWYAPYALDAYKLGLALNKITQANDLVITIAQDMADPVAIYYSRRRGWVFPPVTTNWWEGIQDDEEAIRLLKELRTKGAQWFGVVNSQKENIWRENPKFAKYIEQTFEPIQNNTAYIIYRIP
ncbi:MAG TPA: hypothetical protein V6C95_02035 [Coleofasciculaceae cyanobacterium]